MSELKDFVETDLGLTEENVQKAMALFERAVETRVGAYKDQLATTVEEYLYEKVGSTIENLEEAVDELMSLMLAAMVGTDDERREVIRRLGAAVREKAVDSHSDDWGDEAPDDQERNLRSVRGKRQRDHGFGESTVLEKANVLNIFEEVTTDLTEDQRDSFVTYVGEVEVDGRDAHATRMKLLEVKNNLFGEETPYARAISRTVRKSY